MIGYARDMAHELGTPTIRLTSKVELGTPTIPETTSTAHPELTDQINRIEGKLGLITERFTGEEELTPGHHLIGSLILMSNRDALLITINTQTSRVLYLIRPTESEGKHAELGDTHHSLDIALHRSVGLYQPVPRKSRTEANQIYFKQVITGWGAPKRLSIYLPKVH